MVTWSPAFSRAFDNLLGFTFEFSLANDNANGIRLFRYKVVSIQVVLIQAEVNSFHA